jgi:hypothetical protein
LLFGRLQDEDAVEALRCFRSGDWD